MVHEDILTSFKIQAHLALKIKLFAVCKKVTENKYAIGCEGLSEMGLIKDFIFTN